MQAAFGAAAGVAGSSWLAFARDVLRPPIPATPDGGGITGVYDVAFSSSGARSAWHNDREGLPMHASDFPGPRYGAQGRIEPLALNVAVLYLDQSEVNLGMRGVRPPGFAVFNAKCTHLGCTCLWRDEAEAKWLVPVTANHDMIVDPCQLCTFDPYNSGKVVFGPPPRPLEQLRLLIENDRVRIAFDGYQFGGTTPQV